MCPCGNPQYSYEQICPANPLEFGTANPGTSYRPVILFGQWALYSQEKKDILTYSPDFIFAYIFDIYLSFYLKRSYLSTISSLFF